MFYVVGAILHGSSYRLISESFVYNNMYTDTMEPF
jgi:hypothetical protein